MIITVSRQFGSDGEPIARRVAQELSLTVIDRAYVRAAALEAGVPAELLKRLMYEGQRSVAGEIIQGLGSVSPHAAVVATATNPLLGVFAPVVSTEAVTLEEAARAVGQVIKNIALRDNILILGQGGQALLQGQPGVCHVLCVAPLDLRVARVAGWHKLSMSQARRAVRNNDDGRRDYLARYHNVRWQDPLLYHLVINTGPMPVDGAVELVIRAAHAVSTTA